MLRTLFSRHSLHSLLSMLISWVLASVLSVLYDGTGSLSEMISYAMLVLSFVAITWIVGIFPFVHWFNKFLHKQANRIYFPLLSTGYATIVFALLLSVLLGIDTAFAVFKRLDVLVITAALIGCLWGILYLLMYMAYRRGRYTNI